MIQKAFGAVGIGVGYFVMLCVVLGVLMSIWSMIDVSASESPESTDPSTSSTKPAFSDLVPVGLVCPRGYEISDVNNESFLFYEWVPTCGGQEVLKGDSSLPDGSFTVSGTDLIWNATTYVWHSNVDGLVYSDGVWNKEVTVREGQWVEIPDSVVCHVWDSGNVTCRNEGYWVAGETKLVPVDEWPPVW
jgi:hypothetical protein